MADAATNSPQVRRRKAPKRQPQTTSSIAPDSNVPEEKTFIYRRPATWLDPGTWSGDYKYLPAAILFLIVATAALTVKFYDFTTTSDVLELSSLEACSATFNYGFRINAAVHQAKRVSKSRAASGLAFEGVMEVLSPERSVFNNRLTDDGLSTGAFPGNFVPGVGRDLDDAGSFAKDRIVAKINPLYGMVSNESPADLQAAARNQALIASPHQNATLGVASIMLAQKWKKGDYSKYARGLKARLLDEVPRHKNGAISEGSQAADEIHLIKARDIGFSAPFLAYFAVATQDVDLLRETVQQCGLYRDLLLVRKGKGKGSWNRALSFNPAKAKSDTIVEGAFAVDNALAAYGMVRVLSTIQNWALSNASLVQEKVQLKIWVSEILNAAIATSSNTAPRDHPDFVGNYLDDPSSPGEISGTALLVAIVYRLALLDPSLVNERSLAWAHAHRNAVLQNVDTDGFARPAVNAEEWSESSKFVPAHNEAHAFAQSALLSMGAGYRDCVCGANAGCLKAYQDETGVQFGDPSTFEGDWLSRWYDQRIQDIRDILINSGLVPDLERLNAIFAGLTGFSPLALWRYLQPLPDANSW